MTTNEKPIDTEDISASIMMNHIGLKSIFTNIFDANLKNLIYILQGHEFLAMISKLEVKADLLSVEDWKDPQKFDTWIKTRASNHIMLVIFTNEAQKSVENTNLFDSHQILPIFLSDQFSKKHEDINKFLKKFKKKEIILNSDIERNHSQTPIIYYHLVTTEEAHLLCEPLKSKFNEDSLKNWCISKSSTVISLLCRVNFCLSK